jgi:hypothetical protein
LILALLVFTAAGCASAFSVRDLGARGAKRASDRAAAQTAIDALRLGPGDGAGRTPVIDLRNCRNVKAEP